MNEILLVMMIDFLIFEKTDDDYEFLMNIFFDDHHQYELIVYEEFELVH